MTTQNQADRIVGEFAEAAKAAFGPDLRAVVLFGSAADGHLRATSDVNVIVVLKAFDVSKADGLRESLRTARAAVKLLPMFVLESEIAAASEAFAVKFDDVARRHRVIAGDDPFATLTVPRPALIAQVRQVLLNQLLRLRERYVERSLREEQLVLVIADAASALRSAAAAILELERSPAPSAKEALIRLAPGRDEALRNLSRAREEGHLPPGTAGPTLISLIDVARELYERSTRLS
jgi:predicted nucleotidyltransferase